ncbi:MAG: carbohydrate ABC transporter permease [Anaerolineales bacterium]
MSAQPLTSSSTVRARGSFMKALKSFWDQKLSHFGLLDLIVITGVLLYFLLTILPLFMAFAFSLTNQNLLYKTSDFIGFDNYIDLLDDKSFIRSLWMTTRLSFLVTLFANFGGLAVALMLNVRDRFHSALRTIFFIPQVLSAVIVSFIWRIILVDQGLLNSFLRNLGLIDKPIHWLGDPQMAFNAIVMVVTWQMLGFCTVIYLASLQGIPKDLIEAAQIDGANRWQQFRSVVWPLLAPGVTINMVLLLIMTFKLYDQIAVLTGGGPGGRTETLSYYIIRIAFTGNQLGYGSTMAVVLFITTGIISALVVSQLKRREIDY